MSSRFWRLASVLAVLGTVAVAQAQNFPSRSVRIVVPFPPGGGFDVATRVVAVKLGDELKQPVVVENVAGAGGYIGARVAARAPADGYTLFACGISTHGTGPALYKNPAVDSEKEFAPLTMIGSNPNVLVASKAINVNTFPEFKAWAKAGGSSLSYASPGLGTAPELTMEVIKQSLQVDLVKVLYKGDAPALQDVMAGHVPVMVGGLGQHLATIRGGLTRPIAVTSLKRHPSLPDVPTLHESGLPGLEVLSWVGLCAPAGTPTATLDILHASITRVLNQPDTRAQLAQRSWDAAPMARADFASFISAEIARWRKVTQLANIQLD